jgi:hypothetical protein
MIDPCISCKHKDDCGRGSKSGIIGCQDKTNWYIEQNPKKKTTIEQLLAARDKEWVSKLESIMNMYEDCEDECGLCLFRDGCLVKKLKGIIADLTGRSIGL